MVNDGLEKSKLKVISKDREGAWKKLRNSGIFKERNIEKNILAGNTFHYYLTEFHVYCKIFYIRFVMTSHVLEQKDY